jgi:hypothetical protein
MENETDRFNWLKKVVNPRKIFFGFFAVIHYFKYLNIKDIEFLQAFIKFAKVLIFFWLKKFNLSVQTFSFIFITYAAVRIEKCGYDKMLLTSRNTKINILFKGMLSLKFISKYLFKPNSTSR